MSSIKKFRAWDKDLAKYLGGCEIDSLMAELSADDDGKGVIIKQICPARYIFEQFTGLLDRNGKEIYEGDIVRYADDYEENAEVVFDDGGFQVEWPIYIERLEGDITCMMEVIGNIHENPELLEDK